MSNKRIILVTGGSGLVGNALKEALKNAIFNTLLPDITNDEWIFLDSTTDLLVFSEVEKCFQNIKPTHIIHLAAIFGGLNFNIESNLDLFRVNQQLNDNVLKAAAETDGVKKVISCLSTCIFPEHVDSYPIDESQLHRGHPHKTNSGYAYSKRLIDILNRFYMERYNDKLFTSIIPCNIFGPHDNFNIEQGHIIPGIMHKIYLQKMNQTKELEVLGSGTPLRQFIFSHDIAKLIIWAIYCYEEKEPIIFAPKEEYSIIECVKLICKAADFDPIIKLNQTNDDGQKIKTADNSKLFKYLPDFKFTPIEDALKITYDWFSNNYEHARIGRNTRITSRSRDGCKDVSKDVFKIKMMCNWCSTEHLLTIWDKMGTGNRSYTKNGITLQMVGDEISEDSSDYIVVVNSTGYNPMPSVKNLKKTIFMKMEPIFVDPIWEYIHNNPELLKARFSHLPGNYNNNEWHISKTLPRLLSELPSSNNNSPIVKYFDKEISAVLSSKNFYPGHAIRLNFAKEAQHHFSWHSYGSNVCATDMSEWKDCKGSLPLYEKDLALIPYKYTFNCENAILPGYYTEKLIDAILCETLCFYYGHEDIKEHIDPRAYVFLDITNIEESIRTIQKTLDEDLWSKRLPYIRQAKKRILEETGFFPRLFETIVGQS